jgi:ArsR family transcriptional regulator
MTSPSPEETCARRLRALSEPRRLRLAVLLWDSPLSVTDAARLMGEPPVNVSHHLKVLREAGIVRRNPAGRYMVYSLVRSAAHADAIDLGHLLLRFIERPPNFWSGFHSRPARAV